ncbi:unnamed protein product [Arabidopsis thaliana]|uniref:(thale cress) hypothetical protein n=1 Tax=Arabidopsis thaliana TaxID=3702 RepID=A0A7G2EJ86_ARATH|nr:unnamed protein product [Arabidopsis thaliana]
MMLPVFRAAVARGLRSSGGKYSSALGAIGLKFKFQFVLFLTKLRIRDQEEASSSSSHPLESASLLAEHRKRHGLYYLSYQKNDIHNDSIDDNNTLNEYPPANEISVDSFNTKKKMNQSKLRPVVVQLDKEDGLKTKGQIQRNFDRQLELFVDCESLELRNLIR